MSAEPLRAQGGVAPARPASPGARVAPMSPGRPQALPSRDPSARAATAPRTRATPARQGLPGARPNPASAPPRRAPHLYAVTTPARSRSLTPFATLCVTIILGALAAVLILNTAMARGSYESVSMRREIAEFHQQRVTLLTELEAASAPAGLASSAQELGMVRAGRIGFVSLADGVVLESSAG